MKQEDLYILIHFFHNAMHIQKYSKPLQMEVFQIL